MTTDDGDPVGVYFGTTSGEVWASTDEGALDADRSSTCPRSTRVEAAAPTSLMRGPHPHPAAVLHRQEQVGRGRRRRRSPSCSPTSTGQFPGLRFRVVDEQDRLRPHMKVFVNDEAVRDLSTPVPPRTRSTSCRPSPAAEPAQPGESVESGESAGGMSVWGGRT